MVSRRSFLGAAGKAAIASYPAMLALGMLKAAPAHPFDLHKTSYSKGKKILILGAGIAGLTTAFELNKLGYSCIILEAQNRPGGRCLTIRRGSATTEIGLPSQTCDFDQGQYFNAGPSRIPHHHELTLHYCRELGIPIQVYNNINEASYYFSEGNGPLSNKKIRVREIHNDVRGYMSEMLAKAIDQEKIDLELSKEDAQKIIEYLRAEGGLNIDRLYKASDRRGYTESPGAYEKVGKIADPHKLNDIISSGLMNPDFYNVSEYVYELQMTMFQAVGGMDSITSALAKKMNPGILFNHQVKSIANTENGIRVIASTKSGEKEFNADLCICTIPMPVLSNLEHNFPSEVSRAIDYIPYIATAKMGLQFRRRFWEEDEQIYGGITHTNNDLSQIFYPSYDYLQKKGVLIGYYNFNDKARRVGEMNYQQREQFAKEKGRLIHPQYDQDFEKSFSVSWHKMPHSLGGWALYNTEARETSYKSLLKPVKNVYFAGEHMTYLNAWMAGAFESARRVVTDIHARVSEQRLSYPSQQ